MSWTDDHQDQTRYSIFVHIDASKGNDSVSVDLGVLPAAMAVEALRQAYESVCSLVESACASVAFRGQTIEFQPVDSDDD